MTRFKKRLARYLRGDKREQRHHHNHQELHHNKQSQKAQKINTRQRALAAAVQTLGRTSHPWRRACAGKAPPAEGVNTARRVASDGAQQSGEMHGPRQAQVGGGSGGGEGGGGDTVSTQRLCDMRSARKSFSTL